jgi:ubiquitin-protein ligase
MNHRRILRETQSLAHYNAEYFTAKYRPENSLIWDVTITTDIDSDYGRIKHELEFVLPNNYPFMPPKVRFVSPMKNWCVASNGVIDLDILNSAWSPAYSIGAIIVAITSFLNDGDMDYLKSRQMKRNDVIKQELIETVWGKFMCSIPELDIYG